MTMTLMKTASVARKLLALLLVVTTFTACATTPATPGTCDGVDRSLTGERKAALAPEIAKQLHVSSVDVLQSFQVTGWTILYVDTHQSDDAFLFYAHDPLTSPYVTLWSGGAASTEEQEIKTWTLKNAPGIPPKLAHCFAWHVTNDRDL